MPDGIAGGLCGDCISHGIRNNWKPPWQPDARGRLTALLVELGWVDQVAIRIAELIHDVSEP